jgi:hypothetical protein
MKEEHRSSVREKGANEQISTYVTQKPKDGRKELGTS